MATNAKNLAELLNTDTTVAVGDIADGSVTTAKLAADAVTTAKVTDGAITQVKTSGVGRGKNLIINGAMRVNQRGNATGVSSGGAYVLDRFLYDIGSSGTFSYTQDTSAPVGFANSFKVDCTTADSTPNYHLIVQKIEGQNVQHICKGTSSAKQITLSFYVKSNKTGTYSVNARDNDNNRFCHKSYTINAADTWEKKTVTFPADTTGAFDNDNLSSLHMEWWIAAGSTYNSGSTPGVWGANVNGNRAAANTVTIGTSTDDNWFLTGVQLEVGDTATDFEHRLITEELSLCQRYYYPYGLQDNDYGLANSLTGNANRAAVPYMPGLEMRATPTITFYHWDTGATGVLREFSSGTTRTISSQYGQGPSGGGYIQFSSNLSNPVLMTVKFDAEL